MEPVHGTLELMSTSNDQVRIRLDGDRGDILLGGQGRGGDIELMDDTGTVKIRLDAGGAEDPAQPRHKSEITVLLSGEGNLSLGGNGNNGDLLLMPSGVSNITDTSKAAIWLDGGERTIRLRSSSAGKDTIQLIADRGKIVLGGNAENGDLLVFASTVSGANLADRDKEAAIWIRGGQGDILLANGDCAEDFDVSGSDAVEPGTVMVLDREGKLVESTRAYDKKVAGVISGAGDYKPGIVLDRKRSLDRRHPVALLGKTYCKVDARYAPIEVGDLLTTSPTPGHAMKANDPLAAFGAVIGKALRPLDEGSGLIPVLIALQ